MSKLSQQTTQEKWPTNLLKSTLSVESPSHSNQMAITKDNCWQGCRDKGTVTYCWWGWESFGQNRKHGGSHEAKIKLPFDTAISLLGIYQMKSHPHSIETSTHPFSLACYSQ